MGKEKIRIHEEPTWKQQRKKLEAEARRNKIWMGIGLLAIAAVAFGLVFITVRGMVGHKTAKPGKLETRHAIATIIGTANSLIGGKRVRVTTFKYGNGDIIERPITDKDKTLKKNDQVDLTYTSDLDTGDRKIVDWVPFKEAAAPISTSTSSSK